MIDDNKKEIADLMDFHLRWAEFRQDALSVSKMSALSEQEKSTITWLIAMADRIGKADIKP